MDLESIIPREPILSEKASAAIARVIRIAILEGDFPPGQPLREIELARWLGISRTPVREALLILENEGLVESIRYRTTQVRQFSADDLQEMYSIRAILEGYAARLAAQRVEAEDGEVLREGAEEFDRLVRGDANLVEIAKQNMAFHEKIHQMAHAPRLTSMIQTVTALPLIYRSYMEYSKTNRQRAAKDHTRIADAIITGDEDRAESLMMEHVRWARDVAIKNLAKAHEIRE